VSLIFDPRPRIWQPPQHIAPRADGIGAGLIACIVPGVGDLCGNFRPVIGANGDLRAFDAGGLTIRGSGSANIASFAADLSAVQQLTITAILRVDSWKTANGQFDMLFEFTPDGAANNGGFNVYNHGLSSDQFTMARQCNGGVQSRSFQVRPSAAQWNVISASWDNFEADTAADPLQFRLWFNGIRFPGIVIPANGNSTQIPTPFANSTLNILSRNAASLPTTGDIAGIFIHNRILSPAEQEALGESIDAPWRYLFPDWVEEVPFDEGGGGTTIEATPAVASAATQPAQIIVGRVINASPAVATAAT